MHRLVWFVLLVGFYMILFQICFNFVCLDGCINVSSVTPWEWIHMHFGLCFLCFYQWCHCWCLRPSKELHGCPNCGPMKLLFFSFFFWSQCRRLEKKKEKLKTEFCALDLAYVAYSAVKLLTFLWFCVCLFFILFDRFIWMLTLPPHSSCMY